MNSHTDNPSQEQPEVIARLITESFMKGQLEMIQGYITKIDIDQWTIEDVRNSLSKDREYLEQEFGLLQANKIIQP
jgi:hypothetical protein